MQDALAIEVPMQNLRHQAADTQDNRAHIRPQVWTTSASHAPETRAPTYVPRPHARQKSANHPVLKRETSLGLHAQDHRWSTTQKSPPLYQSSRFRRRGTSRIDRRSRQEMNTQKRLSTRVCACADRAPHPPMQKYHRTTENSRLFHSRFQAPCPAPTAQCACAPA